MVDWEKFGPVAIVGLLILAIVLLVGWMWVCFIAAGAILTWLGFSGSGFLAVQIVVTMIILAFCAMMERIGRKAFA